MAQSLQESIDQILAMLPTDGSKVPYDDFREKVMKSGIESAQTALAVITKNKLANLAIVPRAGLQADPETKKVLPGQPRPHVILNISR